MTTEQISVRIDPATKSAAENVFNLLGLSATDAVRMFYRQVILHRGLPFAAQIPNAESLSAFAELDAGKGKKQTLNAFKARMKKAGA